MVPVLDSKKVPLMPCSEKRARKLLEKGEAKSYFKEGIFCIILQKEPSKRDYQEVAIGVDTGSKREGYTVATEKSVVLNITSDTPCRISLLVSIRFKIRRDRRQRKTPYRKCRANRSSRKKLNRMPHSTKARWGAKLRIVKKLQQILPLTVINVEDLKVITQKGKRKWNISFSPLQTGKNWFYKELESLGLELFKTEGFETKEYRDLRGFKKTKKKLDYVWEAHNVDSHILCEKVLNSEVKPFKGIYVVNFFKFHRRQLHVQNFKKGVRKQYGGTISQGIARGSLVVHKKYGKVYVGGCSDGKLSVHDIKNNKRISQRVKIKDFKILNSLKWTTNYKSKKTKGIDCFV